MAKLVRAIESNVGERRRYKKQLIQIQREFQTFILNQIYLELDRMNDLTDGDEIVAMDAELGPSDQERSRLKRIKTMMLKRHLDMSDIMADIVGRNINRWLKKLSDASVKVAQSFVNKTVSSTTRAQRSALTTAGVSPGLMEKWWNVPVVGKQHVSASVANAMPDMIRDNVSLITKIGERDIQRISEVLTNGLTNGLNYNELRKQLRQTEGFDSARADRVALDQINKINQQVQIMNAQSLGCTHGRWKHVPGAFSSRKTHIAMDGKEFDLAVGMYDPAVNMNVKPGELPYCRCVFNLVLPKEL